MPSLIRQLEELAARAWPTAETQEIDGWLCRYANSTSRRLNSSLPLQINNTRTLEERVLAVERFYETRQRPPRFQMSPAVQPPELDTFLAQQGYSFKGRVLVQTAPIAAASQPLPSLSRGHISLSSTCPPGWFETYLAAEPGREKTAADRRAIFQRIKPATAYTMWQVDGIAAAIGLGVLEQEWMGVFCMSTLPDYRRQGAAALLLQTLARWGREQGATGMYLQVFEGNAAALSVYAQAGFQTLYPIHFREKRD